MVLVMSSHGVVEDVIKSEDAGEDIEYHKGVLTPGFINTHCHLELSHMKGLIPTHTGLIPFLLSVVGQREEAPEKILEAIATSEMEMIQNGIVAVGDICNTDHTLFQKKAGNLYYHNFIETSGVSDSIALDRLEKNKNLYSQFQSIKGNSSIVPHAPYSVSEKLLKLIVEANDRGVMTMHNQESLAEDAFFKNKTGDMKSLYEQLGISVTNFQAPGKSSIQYVGRAFDPKDSLILVHNVFTTEQDVTMIKTHFSSHPQHLNFCLCPNANYYISGQLPDINVFRKNNCNITLGTDSLASNHQLCIFQEIKKIQQHYPEIPLEEMLKWATLNGAQALKINDIFGSFEKGKKPGLTIIVDDCAKKI